MGHRLAGPGPPGAASEPPAAPNGGNLAPARSPAARVHHRHPRGRLAAAPLAAESVPRTPRTPPTLQLAPRVAPTVGARVWHESRGKGTVTELMEDGRTRVAFDSGEEHRYKPASTQKLVLLAPGPAPPRGPPPTAKEEPTPYLIMLRLCQGRLSPLDGIGLHNCPKPLLTMARACCSMAAGARPALAQLRDELQGPVLARLDPQRRPSCRTRLPRRTSALQLVHDPRQGNCGHRC